MSSNQAGRERDSRLPNTARGDFAEGCQSVFTGGFSRVELLAVLAILALLGVVGFPAVAREQRSPARAFCLHRMNQMGRAMTLYAKDGNEWLPPNYGDGSSVPYRNWCGGDLTIPSQATNLALVSNPSTSLLVPYLDGNISLFRCPADATGVDVNGRTVPRTRSISLNNAVGSNPYKSSGKTPTDGSWLNGQASHTANSRWFCYGKLSSFVFPGPALTMTFLEEAPESINDASFAVIGRAVPMSYVMLDRPATFHDMAAAVAFADGHVEMHRWVDSRTRMQAASTYFEKQPDNKDLDWLADHATARVK